MTVSFLFQSACAEEVRKIPGLVPSAADIARPARRTQFRPPRETLNSLMTPPEHLAILVQRGNVEFNFYDPKRNPRQFDGETHFEFYITYRYRYSYQIGDEFNGIRTASVTPSFSEVKITCSNKVYIPERFVREGFWNARLTRHEFEHVRINCDQRPKLIADFLLEQMGDFEIQLKEGEQFSKSQVDKEISERVVKIRTSITDLIQANNDYLDKLTRHGIGDLGTPESFFQSLYDMERLKKLEFAFLDEIKSLVESDDYLPEDK